MAADTDNITLGSGVLYLNNIDVGHLKGDVELTIKREYVDFKPSNMIGVVKKFVVGEEVSLKVQSAELDLDNIKLAYGVTTSIQTSQDSLLYDPSNFSFDASYDKLTIGGSKTINEVPLRFEHTRPTSGVKVIVIFYNAASDSELVLPFKESDITLYDLTFTALADETRSEGDQIGVILENPNKS
jgi:hypothetical protein